MKKFNNPWRIQQEAARCAMGYMRNNPPNYKYYRNIAGSKYNERPRKFNDWYNYYLDRLVYKNKPYNCSCERKDDLRYHPIKRWFWVAYSFVYQLIKYHWPRTKYMGCHLNKER